jgi:RimJ/RimL family protein N-acetyltransferase
VSNVTRQIILRSALQKTVWRPQYTEQYKLRWLTPGEIDLIVASQDRPLRKAPRCYYEKKVAHGAAICAAFDMTGEIVAWRLFQPSYQDLWHWLRVEGGEWSVCGFAAFTIPQARGQKLMRAITSFAAEHFLDLGYTTLIAVTNMDNAAAIAGHRNIGMRHVGTISAKRYLFGLRIVDADGHKSAGFFREGKRFTYHVSADSE